MEQPYKSDNKLSIYSMLQEESSVVLTCDSPFQSARHCQVSVYIYFILFYSFCISKLIFKNPTRSNISVQRTVFERFPSVLRDKSGINECEWSIIRQFRQYSQSESQAKPFTTYVWWQRWKTSSLKTFYRIK